MPVVVSRLGTENITEPSEELRLSLICLLKSILQSYSSRMGPYINDVMLILQNTIVDPYPEVKKVSLCGFVHSTLIMGIFVGRKVVSVSFIWHLLFQQPFISSPVPW